MKYESALSKEYVADLSFRNVNWTNELFSHQYQQCAGAFGKERVLPGDYLDTASCCCLEHIQSILYEHFPPLCMSNSHQWNLTAHQ